MDRQCAMSIWGDACRFCQQARWLLIAVLTIIFVFWGVWGWREVASWYEDTAPAISFGMGEAAQAKAYPSETIVFYQPVHKRRNCPGTIYRVVTGDCGHIVVSDKPSTLQAGFEGRLTIPVQVPYEAIPGKCGFQVNARYICNPFDYVLQRQVFTSPVIPFQVREWGE